jgi:hypothetical protein
VNQLLVRGEQVALISVLDLWGNRISAFLSFTFFRKREYWYCHKNFFWNYFAILWESKKLCICKQSKIHSFWCKKNPTAASFSKQALMHQSFIMIVL